MIKFVSGVLVGITVGALAACGPSLESDDDCDATSTSLQIAEFFVGDTVTVPPPRVTESGQPLTDWVSYLKEETATP